MKPSRQFGAVRFFRAGVFALREIPHSQHTQLRATGRIVNKIIQELYSIVVAKFRMLNTRNYDSDHET